MFLCLSLLKLYFRLWLIIIFIRQTIPNLDLNLQSNQQAKITGYFLLRNSIWNCFLLQVKYTSGTYFIESDRIPRSTDLFAVRTWAPHKTVPESLSICQLRFRALWRDLSYIVQQIVSTVSPVISCMVLLMKQLINPRILTALIIKMLINRKDR